MKRQISRKRFWILYHAGLLIFSMVVSMLMKYKQTGDALHPTVLVTFSTIFVMSACIGYLLLFMVKKARKYNQSQLNKMIVPALLIFYVTAYLIVNLSIAIGVFGWFLVSGMDLSEFWAHLFQHELNFAGGRFFIWLMFFTIAFFYVLWQKSTKKEQDLREENLKFRYRNLKTQVNPHFLFNSLNTLSELVYIDAKKADNYIQKLSGIYRYILENEETDMVPLSEEIAYVKQYFELQKERDDDKISLYIDFPDADSFRIIPVSLQLLVENALKHNAMSKEKPLEIDIHHNGDYIVVSNALQRKNILESSTQTGLSNLKERVKLVMGQEIMVSEDDNRFIVKLPILHV
jgi:two-component system LytT family sensor kinase